MAVDQTTQRVSVISFFGGGGFLGLLDPVSGMPTNYGTITGISGNLAILGLGSTQSQWTTQIRDLTIESSVAKYSYGFPTGIGSVGWQAEPKIADNYSGVYWQGEKANFFR